VAEKRIRRTPDQARQRILEAAEAQLAEGGPGGVRVQALAAQLKITDAAIYHHFGSRAGLLDALARFGARRLRTSMEEVVAGHAASEPDIAKLVELAADAFERRGYARLLLWLAAEGIPTGKGSGMFDGIVSAFEAARPKKRGAAKSLEPRYIAALMVMVCAAEPLFGDMSRRSVSLPSSRKATLDFRNWFAARIADLVAGA
jgi:TetR/AcrR family transcriptional regulator, repressor for neighboring sulfatase